MTWRIRYRLLTTLLSFRQPDRGEDPADPGDCQPCCLLRSDRATRSHRFLSVRLSSSSSVALRYHRCSVEQLLDGHRSTGSETLARNSLVLRHRVKPGSRIADDRVMHTPSYRKLVVSLALATALIVPSAAAAKVRLLSLTAPAHPGAHATLVAAVSPAATCSITVLYKSGSSHAHGLTARRSVAGKVSWTWMVGTNTTPGNWLVYVDCGRAGILRTKLTVR